MARQLHHHAHEPTCSAWSSRLRHDLAVRRTAEPDPASRTLENPPNPVQHAPNTSTAHSATHPHRHGDRQPPKTSHGGFRLNAYAGSEVEVSISYVTDWGTLNTGVFVDDTSVIVDGATVRETSFEDGLDGWEVLGSPEGSAPNPSDWIRTEALIVTWAAVTTPDTVLHGFGFEGISTAEERNEIMRRTLEFLLG
jgi:hypothetical protein